MGSYRVTPDTRPEIWFLGLIQSEGLITPNHRHTAGVKGEIRAVKGDGSTTKIL